MGGASPQRFPNGGRRRRRAGSPRPREAVAAPRRVSLRCRSPERRPGGFCCPPSPREALGSCHSQRWLHRAPATMVGSETEGGSSSALPALRHYFGWLLLPGASAPCHLCAVSVLCLITCLGLFRAAFARLLRGMPFLPLLFLLSLFGEPVCAFHIWSNNVLSFAVWLRLPPLCPARRELCSKMRSPSCYKHRYTAGRTELPLLTVTSRASLLRLFLKSSTSNYQARVRLLFSPYLYKHSEKLHK